MCELGLDGLALFMQNNVPDNITTAPAASTNTLLYANLVLLISSK